MSDLTKGQTEALEKLQDWWKSPEQNFVLKGKPGTGKTFLTEQLVEKLEEASPLFTAPTHEAVGQLQRVLPDQHSERARTTASALGLRLSKTSFHQKLIKGKLPEDFNLYDFLIVDEASMADLELIDHAQRNFKKILWLGDWAQLPPPSEGGSSDSPVFTQGYSEYELTEIKRYSGDILTWVEAVRNQINSSARKVPAPFGGIENISKKKGVLPSLNTEILEEIASGKGRILVWTNQSSKYCKEPGVREYNELVRQFKFGGASSESYLVSDTVIVKDNPLMQAEDTETHEALTLENFLDEKMVRVAPVNSKGEVLRVDMTNICGVEAYRLEIKFDKYGFAVAYTPTMKGRAVYDKMLKGLAEKAINAGDARTAGKIWFEYHSFKELFVTLKHSYCTTTHGAQGLTIPSVYVDVANILQSKDWKLAFKLLNVAGSRAAEKLSLIRSV